jgi:hypothetical protein
MGRSGWIWHRLDDVFASLGGMSAIAERDLVHAADGWRTEGSSRETSIGEAPTKR